MDVLGIGAVAIDDLLAVESYPPADSKATVVRSERRLGGLAANALRAAARLGARCTYAGVLGDDDTSRYAIDALRDGGVDVGPTRIRTGCRPAHSTIILGGDGTRTVFSDRTGFNGPDPDWPPAELIAGHRVLLVDHMGVPASIRAARIAREAAVPVVADFERVSHDDFPTLLALADHLIVGRAFAERLTGTSDPEAAARRLWSDDRRTVVVTCGDRGGVCYDGCNGGWFAAYAVTAVDTTGCGDVFHGAYAAGLAEGLDLLGRLRLASAVAAIHAGRLAGPEGFADRPTVERFLVEQRGGG